MNMLIFKCLQMAFLLVFSSRYTIAEKETQHPKRTYIIHMDKFNMPASFDDHLQWYDSSLKLVSETAEMLYTYKHVAHGFSTRLTTQEADLLTKQPGILSVIPEVRYELHTTRTPEFLGLEKTTTLLGSYGKQSEVIVGVIDTGVWPELKSFDDTGLGPVPSSWKGECETVSGKIVICDRGGNPRAEKSLVVKRAGGIGMILANKEDYGEELVADSYLLPAAALGEKASNEVKKYVSSAPKPTAKIAFGGTQLGVQPSPVVAAFSSRGPNILTPKILKPDLIAPGIKYRVEDLNYPSFAVPIDTASGVKGGSHKSTTVQYKRILTNVGNPATYKVSVSSQSPSVKITVEPQILSFKALNEKKSYTVTFTSDSMPSGTTSFAHLEWSDGKHKVTSPIAFSWT
ncbi:hypothetical protein TSUD_316250 [Trifolium subterraneum]|uniref:Subtilisin-like protease fibronectin type-III domain-containing protein n=1 Tax=Trifolium subterraneum TaxID=3900 RepID=A0A2Z6NY95_TRISU|nr:hypothetical protein TSUD_316250 [Trifolium subterraneum]